MLKKLGKMTQLFSCRKTGPEDEEIVEKTPIEKQIFDSFEVLEKLSVEGDEVVGLTNMYFLYILH